MDFIFSNKDISKQAIAHTKNIFSLAYCESFS